MATPNLPLKVPRSALLPRSGQGGDPNSTEQDPQGRMSADAAGYMELEGAQKDGDCQKVAVEGGISKDLGCCNEFDPQAKTQKFSCGTCTLVTEGTGSVQSAPSGNSEPVISGQPS